MVCAVLVCAVLVRTAPVSKPILAEVPAALSEPMLALVLCAALSEPVLALVVCAALSEPVLALVLCAALSEPVLALVCMRSCCLVSRTWNRAEKAETNYSDFQNSLSCRNKRGVQAYMVVVD
jgi:hypothetical protein